MSLSYRTVVISGVKLFCEGLTRRLEGTPLNVIDSATGWLEAYDKVRTLHPDVVLLDASSCDLLPHVLSLRAIGHVQVVAFAVGDGEGDAIACAEAGVTAFVERSASIDDLVAAVGHGARGELRLSPRLGAALFRRVGALSQPDTPPRGTQLTAREREILLMLRNRLSNKEIAARLGLSLPTVKNHVHHVLAKLGVRRRIDALVDQ
jgi:DNA-binding NarL/FixJ family response regulator